MRHLLSPLDFSVEELDDLLALATDIEHNPDKYKDACKGKKLATLFYEPSTRTRLSFEAECLILAAMYSAFLQLIQVQLQKGKVSQILSELYPAMQISVQCVIQKKVHL